MVEEGWVVAWVMVVRTVGCDVGGGVGGVLVSFEISQGLRIFEHGRSRSQR